MLLSKGHNEVTPPFTTYAAGKSTAIQRGVWNVAIVDSKWQHMVDSRHLQLMKARILRAFL